MKKGWEVKQLSEVCDKITDGSHYSPKTSAVGYPYITVRDINNDLIDFNSCKYICEKDYKELTRNGCKPEYGDVLFSKDGTVGKVSIVNFNKDFVVLSSLAIIRPKKEYVNSTYLKYLLKAPFFLYEAIGRKTGVAIKRIVLRNLKTISVPRPPLPEQKRIVKILDKAFAATQKAKKNAEKNLQNSRELFESYLNGIFAKPGRGWEEKRLGEVCDVRDGTHDSPKYQANGYPLITSKNLKRDGLNFDNIKNISKVDYSNINKRSAVHKGDILFAMIGTIGNPIIVEVEPNFAIKNVALFKIPNDLNNYFLKYYFESEFVKSKMWQEAKGTTQKFVGLGYLRKFAVFLPKLDVQNKIVSKLDALSTETKRLEKIYQQKLVDLEELKKSILQKAFEGEL